MKKHKRTLKGKKQKATVRGPQGDLFGGRTPRMRFLEKPPKRTGQPFFALRVPADVLRAFRRKARPTPQAAVRVFMAKVSGVELGAGWDGEE